MRLERNLWFLKQRTKTDGSYENKGFNSMANGF